MHSPSRRLVALIATAASLGAGSLATTAQASSGTAGTADTGGVQSLAISLIDPVVMLVLLLLGANPTVAQVQTAAAPLTPDQLGGLLQGAGTGQLNAILGGGLDPTQLTSAVTSLASAGALDGLLDTLTPGQTGDLLAPLTGSALSSALSLLNTTQILDALGTLSPAELGAVVDGLTPAQTASLLTTADATQLTSLVTGLTGGQLGGGLALLDTAQLTSLLAVANAALAGVLPGPGATALQGLITTVTGLLGAGPGPGTTPPPGDSTLPTIGTIVPRSGQSGSPAKPPAFTGYRATLGSIKVARTRRSVKIIVSCPAAAPAGCVVTLKGVLAGKKAFAGKRFILLRKAKRTFTMKLSTAATRRLKKKGGSLKVSALTMFSSLPTTTKTVRVARKR